MPDGGPNELPIAPALDNDCEGAPARPGCRSPLGTPRLIGGTRIACEALCRRWAAGDREAVLVALEALLADALSPRAGVGRLVLDSMVAARHGELRPEGSRVLLELGDRRHPTVELAHLVLVTALAGANLPALELAGVVARALRLHHELRVAHVDEDLRDDERGSRVLLDALRWEAAHATR
jgi:hypothetical protein